MRKSIVVSGATKGIGRAIVQRFAVEGFDIIGCARSTKDLEGLKSEIELKFPVKVHVLKADLSQKAETNKFAQFALGSGTEISALVNNAGFFIPGAVHNEEDGVLEQMIETNLYSGYYMTRGLIKSMMARKAGHIFNICSIASQIAYPNGGSYSISKFAMLGMSKVIREEMKEFGVRVTSVLPGATYTASWDGADISEDRLMPAKDVASLVWNAFSLSDRSVVEEIVVRPQLGDL